MAYRYIFYQVTESKLGRFTCISIHGLYANCQVDEVHTPMQILSLASRPSPPLWVIFGFREIPLGHVLITSVVVLVGVSGGYRLCLIVVHMCLIVQCGVHLSMVLARSDGVRCRLIGSRRRVRPMFLCVDISGLLDAMKANIQQCLAFTNL